MSEDVKVLIVDDEPRNLDALEVLLDSSGCTLVRAHSADEALLAMLRHEFAAMIFDIRMPRIGGIELANLVKQRRRTQDVPIIFLTAHSTEDADVLRGYDVGAVDYLSKPVNARILCSKVSVFVDLYRKTRALARVNEELQREVAARQKAQETLERVNVELEVQGGGAHHGPHGRSPRRQGERGTAQDGDGSRRDCRLGVGCGERADDLVDRTGNALRVSSRIVRRGSPRPELGAP